MVKKRDRARGGHAGETTELGPQSCSRTQPKGWLKGQEGRGSTRTAWGHLVGFEGPNGVQPGGWWGTEKDKSEEGEGDRGRLSTRGA